MIRLKPGIFLFCFSFLVSTVVGQQYSNVYYPSRLATGGSPSMFLDGDSALYAFSSDGTNARGTIYRKFNRNGLVTDSVYYQGDTSINIVGLRSNSIVRISPSRLLVVQDNFYGQQPAESILFLIRNNLDTVLSKTYRVNNTGSTNTFDIFLEDSMIILMGHYVTPNNKLSLFISCFDTLLNLQWQKIIHDFRPSSGQYTNGYFPYRLRRMGNNYYIAGRCLYTTQFVEGFLVKTDLQGNLVWDKRNQYQMNNTVTFSILPIGPDSLLEVNLFRSKQIGQDGYNKVFLRILDSSGLSVDSLLYPEEETRYEISNSHFTDDKSILLSGFFFQGGSKAFIWKLDKNLNTIWRRVYYYGDWEDESWLYNVDQWSDGGIIAAGTYWDRYMNPTNKSVYLWLLSTDSLGCLSPGNCGSDINVVEWALPGQGIKVYPIPIAIGTANLLNIELSIPGNPNATASVRMFNEAGQVVLKENIEFVDGLAQVGLQPLGRGSFVLEVKTATHVFYEKIIIQ